MKNNVLNILKKELREMFRDKKSLSMMLIIPIMIPLIIFGMSALFESNINKDISEYNKIGFDYALSEVEKNIVQELEIVPTFLTKEELKEAFLKGEINLYITKEENLFTVHGDDSDTTTFAIVLADAYLNSYKEYLQSNYLKDKNIDASDVIQIIQVEKDISSEENFFASYIINYAFLFIIMAITVSATYPATDTTAGEKERGTLETLLTFPIKSKDIILGKFLSVSISSIITGLLSFLLSLISLKIAGSTFSIYKDVTLGLSNSSLLFSIVVILAYSFLISGLCIAIASRSKSFKEAQSALTPITFISFFPGMIAFMAGVSSTPLLSLIPFLNFTLLFTDISSGVIDFSNILLMLLSTIFCIIIILGIIIKQYKSEEVLF